jgi:hypothetical protein
LDVAASAYDDAALDGIVGGALVKTRRRLKRL